MMPISSPQFAAPMILLTATLRWPIAARLAIAFAKLGCRVEAICPRQHPVTKTRAIGRTYRYSVLSPLATLRRAIESAAPDLIVPCDDNAAVDLQRLYQRTEAEGASATALRTVIARSLGTPEACSFATARGRFMALAKEESINIPSTSVVATVEELDAWLAEHGLPAVIKIDCTWGGQGVSVVRTREAARRAFRRMAARPSIANALVRMLLERDSSFLLNSLQAGRRTVTLQTFIVGAPANRAVACWQGEVLTGISVQAIETQHATGPATVVRVIENPQMVEAARRLVRRLGISGLWGIDFVLDESGTAYAIEMNPRATPICHLPLGPGRNLPAAMFGMLTSIQPPATPARIESDVIAMFPGEWHRDSASGYLRSAYHDIPWDEPALIQDCIDKPWSERGFSARLWARLRTMLPRQRRRIAALRATNCLAGARSEQAMVVKESLQVQAKREQPGA